MSAETTDLQEPPAQGMEEPESGAAEENSATEPSIGSAQHRLGGIEALYPLGSNDCRPGAHLWHHVIWIADATNR
jgi:hypothetical protein